MGDTHVQLRMALQYAAQHQRRGGNGFLVGVAHENAEIEARHACIVGQFRTPTRCGVQKQRHIQLHHGAIEIVEPRIIQIERIIRAGMRSRQTELRDAALQLAHRRIHILHRQGRRA